MPILTVILQVCRALDCSPAKLLSDFTTATPKREDFNEAAFRIVQQATKKKLKPQKTR